MAFSLRLKPPNSLIYRKRGYLRMSSGGVAFGVRPQVSDPTPLIEFRRTNVEIGRSQTFQRKEKKNLTRKSRIENLQRHLLSDSPPPK